MTKQTRKAIARIDRAMRDLDAAAAHMEYLELETQMGLLDQAQDLAERVKNTFEDL